MRSGIVLSFICLAACADSTPAEPPAVLADGVYEVMAVASDAAGLPEAAPDMQALIFDHQFVQDMDDVQPDHVLVRLTGYAPLDLAEPPEVVEEDGGPRLFLLLEPDAGEALAALTARVARVAVVIGGEVVTVHRVRVPIQGGKLQVSC